MDINIHLGDCTTFLKSLPDLSVDFTFYDPPYNVGKNYIVYKDDMSPEDYKSWMIDIAGHARRLSRRGFAVFVSSQLNRLFFEILPEARLIPIIKRAAGITKDNITMQYYSLFVIGRPIIKCKDVWDDIRLPGEGYFFKEERFDHPGLTSQALVKKVLYHFTSPEDIVLDPFLGSGTSAVVALSMGRSFIGSELTPEYFNTAQERIAALNSQSSLFDLPKNGEESIPLFPESE